MLCTTSGIWPDKVNPSEPQKRAPTIPAPDALHSMDNRSSLMNADVSLPRLC